MNGLLHQQTHDPFPDARTAGPDVPDAVRRIHEAAHSNFGALDTWVNNAGVGMWGKLEQGKLEDFKKLYETNFWGIVNGSLEAIKHLKKHGGALINLGSVASDVAIPNQGLYASSKHALEGYSVSLDHEIRHAGVRVVLVEPAYTRTSFESNLVQADQQLDDYQSARSNAESVMRDAMKNADSPEVVAKAVLKASTAANPRRRYTAGGMARQVSLLHRFVPESAFDKSLRKQMRLPA